MKQRSGCTSLRQSGSYGERYRVVFGNRWQLSHTQLVIETRNRASLSMYDLDMVILVKGNYDGVVKVSVISLHLFKMIKSANIVIIM